MTDDALSNALVDVRRAYRLVHAYQRRVCDILAEIDGRARQHGLTFHGWEPQEFDAPMRTSKPFFQTGTWAWPMLPMYVVSCKWRSESTSRMRPRLLVTARADSGFESRGEEPDPSDFDDAERASSTLQIRMLRSRGPKVDWDDVYRQLDERSGGTGGSYELATGKATVWARCIDLDLSELAAPDSLDRLVLAPIDAWARAASP